MAKLDPKILIGAGGLAALFFFFQGSKEADAREIEKNDDPEPDLTKEEKEATKKSSSSGVNSSGGLRKGKSSAYNKPWQRCLCAYYGATYGADSVVNPSTEWDTGTFGQLTKSRTQQFQKDRGLSQDGVVGKATNEAMDKWFAAQSGSFAAGQDARKSVEATSCPNIRQFYAAGQAVAKFFG